MDPLTQGVVGAVAPQSVAKPAHLVAAGLFGWLAGMAPDLDVLIRSDNDPLLFLEYHRQFTHALLFIPVGGALCGLVLYTLLGRRWGLGLPASLGYCTLGYATHALLDACTTYGTQLLWPFSDARFAWHTVSVIDPLFTLTLLMLMIVAAVRRQPGFARLALVWALCYLCLGLVQRERAEAAGRVLAAERGHVPRVLEAKPSFANLLLWKLVYSTEDRFYVDAVRVGLAVRRYTGNSVAQLDLARDFPWLDHSSQQARDIERFRWFSNGYVARDPHNPLRIIDIRFSMLPNQIQALWGIELNPDAATDQHVAYRTQREADPAVLDAFWHMLGGGAAQGPVVGSAP